jgi:hypothetical protein
MSIGYRFTRFACKIDCVSVALKTCRCSPSSISRTGHNLGPWKSDLFLEFQISIIVVYLGVESDARRYYESWSRTWSTKNQCKAHILTEFKATWRTLRWMTVEDSEYRDRENFLWCLSTWRLVVSRRNKIYILVPCADTCYYGLALRSCQIRTRSTYRYLKIKMQGYGDHRWGGQNITGFYVDPLWFTKYGRSFPGHASGYPTNSVLTCHVVWWGCDQIVRADVYYYVSALLIFL